MFNPLIFKIAQDVDSVEHESPLTAKRRRVMTTSSASTSSPDRMSLEVFVDAVALLYFDSWLPCVAVFFNPFSLCVSDWCRLAQQFSGDWQLAKRALETQEHSLLERRWLPDDDVALRQALPEVVPEHGLTRLDLFRASSILRRPIADVERRIEYLMAEGE